MNQRKTNKHQITVIDAREDYFDDDDRFYKRCARRKEQRKNHFVIFSFSSMKSCWWSQSDHRRWMCAAATCALWCILYSKTSGIKRESGRERERENMSDLCPLRRFRTRLVSLHSVFFQFFTRCSLIVYLVVAVVLCHSADHRRCFRVDLWHFSSLFYNFNYIGNQLYVHLRIPSCTLTLIAILCTKYSHHKTCDMFIKYLTGSCSVCSHFMWTIRQIWMQKYAEKRHTYFSPDSDRSIRNVM